MLNSKQRNPLIKTPMGNYIQTIGDTHLGRVFKNDVPLDRRGEYEETQWNTLLNLLASTPTVYDPLGLEVKLDRSNFIRTQVGDWFDKPNVALAAVLRSSTMLKTYAEHHSTQGPKNIPLAILSGNHDDAKNLSDVTSWDMLRHVFDTLTWATRNTIIHFVKDAYIHTFDNGEQVLFIGWNITDSAIDCLMSALDADYQHITTVVCHLDKISYGNDDNVIPYDFFASKGIKMVVSGHEHKPYHFFEQGMEVIGTGSLLPFSHAEDDGEEIYVTLNSIAEFKAYSKDTDISHKHIRLILDEADQELIPTLGDVTSLSLKIVKRGVDLNVLDDIDGHEINQVSIDAYDAQHIWKRAVVETGLDQDSAELVWSEINAKGVEE